MLTIARLRPDGSERTYYERKVATSQEDYYAGAGEAAGEWVGAAADRLDLSGTLANGDLTRLLQGLDPVSGKALRPPPPARDLVRTRMDPGTGERITELVAHRPVAGFDLTFSAPKSVSLLFALSDAGVQGVIAGAHRAAWHDAMALLEDEACVVRSGTNGVVRERSGFAAAGSCTGPTAMATRISTRTSSSRTWRPAATGSGGHWTGSCSSGTGGTLPVTSTKRACVTNSPRAWASSGAP